MCEETGNEAGMSGISSEIGDRIGCEMSRDNTARDESRFGRERGAPRGNSADVSDQCIPVLGCDNAQVQEGWADQPIP